MGRRSLAAVGVAALVVVAVVLSRVLAGRHVTPPDPWQAQVPTALALEPGWVEVPAAHVVTVASAARADAEALLEARPIVESGAAELARLLGPREVPAGTRAYLVRGLHRDPGAGRFWARTNGVYLHVRFGCLGASSPPTRCPVVVFLPSRPETLYVDTEAAE